MPRRVQRINVHVPTKSKQALARLKMRGGHFIHLDAHNIDLYNDLKRKFTISITGGLVRR